MIIINTSFELEHKTGIGSYILVLLKAFNKLKLDYKTVELKLPKCFKFKYFWQLLWLNTFMYFYTLIKKPEFFISPSFIMPYLKRTGTKYITVIHDLAVLRADEVTKYVEFIYKLFLKIAVKRADIIVAVSNTIKNELIHKYNINPKKIMVIYNSIGENFIKSVEEHDILEQLGIKKCKYILSVATLNKRKNIPMLTKAFENISSKCPDLKLVLVGGMGNEQRENLTKHKNIVFTGYVKDEELPTLYKNALLYMYPSLYEGFGIPLIDAQYCGCPVLCSDIPVFREVAQNSAEYCIPVEKDIALKLEYLINNPKRLQELSFLGQENIKRFSTDEIIKQLQEVLSA